MRWVSVRLSRWKIGKLGGGRIKEDFREPWYWLLVVYSQVSFKGSKLSFLLKLLLFWDFMFHEYKPYAKLVYFTSQDISKILKITATFTLLALFSKGYLNTHEVVTFSQNNYKKIMKLCISIIFKVIWLVKFIKRTTY